MSKTLLLVGHPRDEHCDRLERVLAEMGRADDCARISSEMLPRASFTWRPPGRLSIDGVELLQGQVAGIWRRPGRPTLEGYDARYSAFMLSECEDAFRGALASLDIRWLSSPEAIGKAELKLYQLQVADELGIPYPDTVVTNASVSAQSFSGGEVVAKPVRYGLLSSHPHARVAFAQAVGTDDLAALAGSPVILQQRATVAFHLRITTVGERAFVAGLRATDEVDWRQKPENHQRFQRDELPSVVLGADVQALRIAASLGLGLSAQDWLVTDEGRLLFLEANPGGQWLFLDDLFDGELAREVATSLTRLQAARP